MGKHYTARTIYSKTVQRRDFVVKLLEQGLRNSLIVRQLVQHENLKEVQARKIIKKAWEYLQEQRAKAPLPSDSERVEHALEALLERALILASKGDVRAINAGISAAMGLAKIRGLLVEHATIRSTVEIRQSVEKKIEQMTTAERQARIQQLLAQTEAIPDGDAKSNN